MVHAASGDSTLDFELRQATEQYYPFLFALFRATMQESISALWGGWDEERWSTFFRQRFDAARYRVVVVDRRDVGAIVVDVRPGEVYLDTVEVAPEM